MQRNPSRTAKARSRSTPETPCCDRLRSDTRFELADGDNLFGFKIREGVQGPYEDFVIPGIGVSIVIKHIAIRPASSQLSNLTSSTASCSAHEQLAKKGWGEDEQDDLLHWSGGQEYT